MKKEKWKKKKGLAFFLLIIVPREKKVRKKVRKASLFNVASKWVPFSPSLHVRTDLQVTNAMHATATQQLPARPGRTPTR